MKDTNVFSVNLWKDGTRKGMGANLFFFTLLMFVAQMILGAFGHATPESQMITVAVLQTLLLLASALVAGGALSDKKHERELKKLDIVAANPAVPANESIPPAV